MNQTKIRSLRYPKSKIGKYLAKVTIVAIAYFLGGRLAVAIPGVELLGSSIWPPAGIAQAALLLIGIRYWPGVALGTFFFELLRIKPSLSLALQAAFGSTLQAVFAVALLNYLGFNISFNRLRDVINFIIISAIISTQINSSLGPLRMCLGGLFECNKYWEIRWHWFLGDAMGILIFTPLILILFQIKPKIKYRASNQKKLYKNWLTSIVLSILLITVSWVVFTARNEAAIARYPLEYLPFPFIIWAAIQWAQPGAVFASFLISCIAIWGAVNGGGPFIAKGDNINQAILFLQAFLSVITTTSLLLAATVAERASAENLLRESEIKYRELVESGNSIIVKLDTQGKITFFNEFAQKFFGFSEGEIVGKSPVGIIVNQNEAVENSLAKMIIEIGNNPEFYQQNEIEHIRKNGEKVWVSWSNKMLLDANNKFIGIIAIGTDITERRKAELAIQKLNEELEIRVAERTATLAATEAELRGLFAAMTDVILIVDSQGYFLKIVSTNPALLFKPLSEQVGKTLHELLPKAEADICFTSIKNALATQKTINFEYSLYINNQQVWFSANISPLSEEKVIWVARDISDRKKSEVELRLAKERSEQLLLNILPQPIAERLKEDSSVIAESFNEVTIMFADIVGFTSLSTKLQPIELVNLLNEIFSTFDQLVEELGLEKIKTIGDAYMVAGGLPIPRSDHAEAIADLALTMLNVMQQFQSNLNEELQIRIGINTGIVVAGVIGKKKFIYDLWGDAVNVASRMESHGIPGYIQVTEATYQKLKHKYIFEKREEIHVKGKGKMTTYFLNSRQAF